MTDRPLKLGWTRVRFGDVVRLVTDRCDPVQAGLERFVGLEHLEPGDLRLRAWGNVADGVTFTNRFRPGHVLFGKRRAYQRKVAVADFDGVCSGDIYVFESKNPNRLLPELLPCLCQTDAFFDYAVGTSAGSLSPRTNWTSLVEYEFALPPMADQRRIADAISTAVAVVDAHVSLRASVRALVRARHEATMASVWTTSVKRPMPDLCELLTVGIVVTPAKYYVASGGIPVLRSLNVWPGRYVLDDLKMISEEGHFIHRKSSLRAGDIVLVRTGDAGRPGNASVVPPNMDGWNCVDVVLARPGSSVVPEFLAQFINWNRTASLMQGLSPGTKQKHLSVNNLHRIQVPVPARETQVRIVDGLQLLSSSEAKANERLEYARRLLSKVSQCLGGQ